MSNDYRWLEKLTNKSLKEIFKGLVEEVVIEYKIIYRSHAGEVTMSGIDVITANMPANFYFECPNPECTERTIHIDDKVKGMIDRRDTTFSCVTTCSGKTASDHPHQRCDVTVEYTVTVRYTQA